MAGLSLALPLLFGSGVAAASTATVSLQGARMIAVDGGAGSNWSPDPSQDSQAPAIPVTVPVSTVQVWFSGALALRSHELSTMSSDVSSATGLSADVRSTLVSGIADATTGIDGLSSGLLQDRTLPELRAGVQAMIGYRVLSVLEPQVRLVLEAERELLISGKVADLEPALATAIETEQLSKASAALNALDTDLTTTLTSVAEADAALIPLVLAQGPSDFSDAVNVIADATKTLSGGWSDVASARDDIRRIVGLLAAPG